MLRTARTMVALFALSLSVTKCCTTSFVNPNNSKKKHTKTVPITMKGLLLPHRLLDLSATTPTMGCMIRPDNGPAIQTREIFDFVKPSSRRYGVQ
jgi:hypothetical protein